MKIYTLLLENMESFYDADAWNQSFRSEAKEELANFAKNLATSTYTEHKDSREFQTYCRLFLDYKNDITESGGDLAKFWLNFLDMVSILPNTVHATRCGNWGLYLECVRLIIPYSFAYGHLNYLTTMLGELLNLPTNHPFFHEQFMLGNFSVQLSSVHSFGRIEAAKVIETTINKDSKHPEGWKGFSTKADTVTRWVKNATHRASLKRELHEFVNLESGKSLHKDLSKTRTEKDLKGVQEIIDLLKEVFIHLFEERGLISLSSGIVATTDIKDNLMNAYGKESYGQFHQ